MMLALVMPRCVPDLPTLPGPTQDAAYPVTLTR